LLRLLRDMRDSFADSSRIGRRPDHAYARLASGTGVSAEHFELDSMATTDERYR
jgi:hypothetical protein